MHNKMWLINKDVIRSTRFQFPYKNCDCWKQGLNWDY